MILLEKLSPLKQTELLANTMLDENVWSLSQGFDYLVASLIEMTVEFPVNNFA